PPRGPRAASRPTSPRPARCPPRTRSRAHRAAADIARAPRKHRPPARPTRPRRVRPLTWNPPCTGDGRGQGDFHAGGREHTGEARVSSPVVNLCYVALLRGATQWNVTPRPKSITLCFHPVKPAGLIPPP